MHPQIFARLAIGRPSLPGTRVSRYRSQRSFRHGPSKLKFRRRKGLETGQPEVVDVQRRVPTQVIIVLRSRIAAGPVLVMLSRLQALISQSTTL